MNTDIISQIVKPVKTQNNVRLAIPILIYWAKNGETTHFYEDLYREFGYKKYSGIGKVLEFIQRVIEDISKRNGKEIPTLNSLVKNKESGMPSYGFDFVRKDYTRLNETEKIGLVKYYDSNAINYSDWDWVLTELNLQPYQPLNSEDKAFVKKARQGLGRGEGEEHKALKQTIKHNPDLIGLDSSFNPTEKKIFFQETELTFFLRMIARLWELKSNHIFQMMLI